MNTETVNIESYEDIGIHRRKGTPDHVDENVPRIYEINGLIYKLCDDDVFGPQAWDPYFPVMHYNVYLKSGGVDDFSQLDNESDRYVGDLDIEYDYEAKTMNIDIVGIGDKFKNKGFGVEMYKAVPKLALPDGRMPDEAQFTFITEDHSPEAEHVWKSLARQGYATHVGEKAYMWNSYDDIPSGK